MRDVGRLDSFYEQLKHIHKTYFIDWRFGQLIINFQSWLKSKKDIDDIFYLEESQMIDLVREYADNSYINF